MTYNDYHIEEYIRGLMPDNVRRLFELEMAKDPALRRSVEAERALVNAVRRDAGTGTMQAGASSSLPPALAAKLAATPAPTAIGAGGGILATIFGTKIGVTILSIVGALGVVAGIFLAESLMKGEAVETPVQQIETGVQGNEADQEKSEESAGGENQMNSPLSTETSQKSRPDKREESVPSASLEQERTESSSAREDLPAKESEGRTTSSSTTEGHEQETKNSRGMMDGLQQQENQQKETTPRIRDTSAEIEVEVE